jgi:hypothetical protein
MVRRSLVVVVALLSSCSEEPPADDAASGNEESSEAGGGEPGCAEGEPEQIYRPDMVGCPGNATQCTAAELCGEGWHLCRFIEFEMAGGVETPATEERWLDACVREAGPVPPTCPTSAVCSSSCDTTVSGQSVAATYDCNTAVDLETPLAPLGVAASPGPAALRTGCMGSVCAFADAVETNTPLGATCCRD